MNYNYKKICKDCSYYGENGGCQLFLTENEKNSGLYGWVLKGENIPKECVYLLEHVLSGYKDK